LQKVGVRVPRISVKFDMLVVISLFGLVLRSAESLSETAVTDRPQGVIIVGIYMSSNILLLLLS